MRIKVIASYPIDGQEQVNTIIGEVFETLELKKYYDRDIIKEMNTLGEVAILAEKGDTRPTILNKNEYEIIHD